MKTTSPFRHAKDSVIIFKVSELYLSCHENVDDHAVASNGNEAEKTDGETQEAMPQWVHGRELIPGNIRLMIILLW